MKLDPKSQHLINASQGWMELGDFDAAELELAALPDKDSESAPVIELRSEICARTERWAECEALSKQLVDSIPEHPGYWIKYLNSLFHQGRYEAAYKESLEVVDQFPKDEAINYNMACYAAALDKMEEADIWLEKCFRLCGRRSELRKKAKTDPDLTAYWAWKQG